MHGWMGGLLILKQHLASVLQEGRENANIEAGLAFIWRNLSLHMPYVVRRL